MSDKPSTQQQPLVVMVTVTPLCATEIDQGAFARVCSILAATVGIPLSAGYTLICHAHVAERPPMWRRVLGRSSPSHQSFQTEEAANTAIDHLLTQLKISGSSPAGTVEGDADGGAPNAIQIAAEGADGKVVNNRYVHVDGAVRHHSSVAHVLAALPNVSCIIALPPQQRHDLTAKKHHWYSAIRTTPLEQVAHSLIKHGGTGVPARQGLVHHSRLPVPMLTMQQQAPSGEKELSSTNHPPLEAGSLLIWVDGQYYIGQPTAEVEAAARVLSAHVLRATSSLTWEATLSFLNNSSKSDPLVRVLLTQRSPAALTSNLSSVGSVDYSSTTNGNPDTYGDITRQRVMELNAMSAQIIPQICNLAARYIKSSLAACSSLPEGQQSNELVEGLRKVVAATDPFVIPDGVVPGFGGRCLQEHIQTYCCSHPISAVVVRAHPFGGQNRWTSSTMRDANGAVVAGVTSSPLLLL